MTPLALYQRAQREPATRIAAERSCTRASPFLLTTRSASFGVARMRRVPSRLHDFAGSAQLAYQNCLAATRGVLGKRVPNMQATQPTHAATHHGTTPLCSRD